MTLSSFNIDYFPDRGNPNVTISSIDASGGIVCSRTNGQVPCFIQVSASAILANGTFHPYEDLDYRWDFDDDDGNELIANPGVGGGILNLHRQLGPEAAYCYRAAGTYTIKLTIRGKNRPFFIKKIVTQQITVSDFVKTGGEYWFDSVGGSDSNDGLSSDFPMQSLTALNRLLEDTSNRAFHIKRGSSYSGSVSLNILPNALVPRSGIRIDAYGIGAKPRFNINSGSNSAVFMYNGSSFPSPKDDIVLSNLHFSNSGTSTAHAIVWVGAFGHATAAVSNIYFDNITSEATVSNANINNFTMNCNAVSKAHQTKMGLWNCTLISPVTPSYLNQGIYCEAGAWFFFVGGSIVGGTFGATYDHHIYPNVQAHSLYRAINFGPGSLRNHCINTNWNSVSGSLEYAQFILIIDNNMTGTARCCDFDNGNNDPSATLFKNVVIEHNRIHDLNQDDVIITYATESLTIRDNEVWNCIGGRWYGPAPSAEHGAVHSSHIYRNKIYVPAKVDYSDDILSFPGTVWVQPQTITDNIIQDMRSTARIATIPFAEQVGATINRNQFYTPNDINSKYLRDGVTEKSLADWQAAGFDAKGSHANPNWIDPKNGDFRVAV